MERALQPAAVFSLSVKYAPATALITCAGPATVVELCSAVWFGSEISRRTRHPHFLFDFRAIKFNGTDEDREELGLFAASLLNQVDRIAVVLSPSENFGTGERVAREAGLGLCNFEDVDEAIDWLGTERE